ncbi:MAG: magnesium transporter MgtE N-terminal domain-containing protein, partial [Thiogranum sp.]
MNHPDQQDNNKEKPDFRDDAEALQDSSQKIQLAIQEDNPSAAIQEIESWSIDDVVELLVHMPLRQARILLDWMPRKRASQILLGMHPVNRSTIAKVRESRLLAEIVEEMKPEEAAETAISLPLRTRRQLPSGSQGDTKPIETSQYPADTAGRIMQHKLVVLDQDSTARDA